MAGADAPYDHLPFFYSDLFDLGYEAVGEVDSRLATVETLGGAEPQGDVAYVDDDGRPRGFLLWNVWDKVDAARELIRAGEPVGEGALVVSSRARGRRGCGRRCCASVVFRPLAHLVVLALAPLRVPPPAVVLASRPGAARRRGRARARPPVVAALLVQLKTVLDNADGQLARLTDRVTAFGRYLDSECDLLVERRALRRPRLVHGRAGRSPRSASSR